ncbi:hypothetical protein [Anaeromyxobacter sp. K]|nr:hypothetical protein [Anaeromyxobacter sp. K]
MDVDKLKELVHVKDEDLAALDALVVRREGGAAGPGDEPPEAGRKDTRP